MTLVTPTPRLSAASVTTYQTANEQITIGGQPAQGMGNVYYGAVGATVTVTADVVDSGGNVQTQLDQTALGYPPVLKMPVVKMLGGINGTAADEVYANVTLGDGQLSAEFVLPASGDWKLITDRINRSLASIGADWAVTRPATTFLV